MSTDKLIAEARKALESACSADRLATLHGQLKQHVAERTGRLKAITAKDTSTFGSNPGPERQKVVAAGDVATLRQLDDECKTVEAELEVLRSLQDNVRRKFDEQRATEYAAGMPQAFATLGELLKAQAEAQAAARKAVQAVAALVQELRQQRTHVTRQQAVHGQQLELPAAPPELLQQFMAAQGYTYHASASRTGWFSPTGGPQELKHVAEVLGANVPRPEQVAAA